MIANLYNKTGIPPLIERVVLVYKDPLPYEVHGIVLAGGSLRFNEDTIFKQWGGSKYPCLRTIELVILVPDPVKRCKDLGGEEKLRKSFPKLNETGMLEFVISFRDEEYADEIVRDLATSRA